MSKKQDTLQDIRNDMQTLYDKASCYDGGWAISNSALKDFLKRMDALIVQPRGATFVLADGSRITAHNAEEVVRYMHERALTQAADDKAYMLDVADRTRLQSGVELRTQSAEAFVNDLVGLGLIKVAS